jgi:hypothetical protein
VGILCLLLEEPSVLDRAALPEMEHIIEVLVVGTTDSPFRESRQA